MSNIEANIETIRKVFDDARMTITHDESGTYAVIMNRIECAEFIFDDVQKRIVIKSIFRCASDGTTEYVGSGKYIVEKLIALAKHFGYDLEVEYDVSRLVVPPHIMRSTTVPLGPLYVFSKGKSWYNTLGFYEANYAENQAYLAEHVLPAPMQIRMNAAMRQRVLERHPDLTLPTGKGTVQSMFRAILSDIQRLLGVWAKVKVGADDVTADEKEVMAYYIRLIKQRVNSVKNDRPTFYKKFSHLLYQEREPVAAASVVATPSAFPSVVASVPVTISRKTPTAAASRRTVRVSSVRKATVKRSSRRTSRPV